VPSSTGRRQQSTGESCGKLDVEGGAAAPFAVDPDLPRVIGDDGLHDRQAKAGPVLFGRVVGSEQSSSFLFAQTRAGVRDVNSDDTGASTRDDAKRATVRHRVDGVEQEILHHTPQLLAIASNHAE